MKVGDSIRKAIDDWTQEEYEAAMLHACNAVDGTAAKTFPSFGSNARFTKLLRDNYGILGPMGAPGIDIVNTRWPVKVQRPKAKGGQPDIADVIYGIHRCTHGHGAELPDGFQLIPDAAGPAQLSHLGIEKGKVRLSDRTIFALIAVAVTSKENIDQHVPDGYHLTFAGEQIFYINDWWGRAAEFEEIVTSTKLPSVKLDFKEWTDDIHCGRVVKR